MGAYGACRGGAAYGTSRRRVALHSAPQQTAALWGVRLGVHDTAASAPNRTASAYRRGAHRAALGATRYGAGASYTTVRYGDDALGGTPRYGTARRGPEAAEREL